MRSVALALLLLSGCNLSRTAARLTVPVIQRGNAALEADDDVAFARAAAPAQIKTAEGLLETLPEDRDLLLMVAQGYTEYTFGFLEDELESLPAGAEQAAQRTALIGRATAFYDRALGFALRHLATFDPAFPEAFRQGGSTLEAALARLPGESAPGLAVAGVALASAINLNRGDPSRLVDLPKALAVLARAQAMAPRFMAGVPAMVLGIIYAQKPALGGQPQKAKRQFDQAIAVTGGAYLMARVMYARAYAVAIGDRSLFESTLGQVLQTAPATLPRQFRLPNELARRRAARYLAGVDEWFPRQR